MLSSLLLDMNSSLIHALQIQERLKSDHNWHFHLSSARIIKTLHNAGRSTVPAPSLSIAAPSDSPPTAATVTGSTFLLKNTSHLNYHFLIDWLKIGISIQRVPEGGKIPCPSRYRYERVCLWVPVIALTLLSAIDKLANLKSYRAWLPPVPAITGYNLMVALRLGGCILFIWARLSSLKIDVKQRDIHLLVSV